MYFSLNLYFFSTSQFPPLDIDPEIDEPTDNRPRELDSSILATFAGSFSYREDDISDWNSIASIASFPEEQQC